MALKVVFHYWTTNSRIFSYCPCRCKIQNGNMKYMLKEAYKDVLPSQLLQRREKMGFPVPLQQWFSGDLNDMIHDIFRSTKAVNRDFINHNVVLENFGQDKNFSRKTWGLLNVELWHQQFHDNAVALVNDRMKYGNIG